MPTPATWWPIPSLSPQCWRKGQHPDKLLLHRRRTNIAGGCVSLRYWPQPVVTCPPLYSRPRALRLLCTPHHSIHPLHAYRPSLYRQTPCQVCSLQECCRWHGQNSGLLVIALLTCFGPQHQIYWRCAASDEDAVASGFIQGKICFLEKIWNLT